MSEQRTDWCIWCGRNPCVCEVKTMRDFSLSVPTGTTPIRHLTASEQRVMGEALRASTRIIPDPRLGEAMAQIKRMQDFLCERGLFGEYQDWTLRNSSRLLDEERGRGKSGPRYDPRYNDGTLCS